MTPDQVDRELQEVFDELVRALYVTKQLVWAAPSSRRGPLQDVLTFLIEQSHLVDEAEARIGGRAERMASPSSHDRRNLLGDVGNDGQVALAVYAQRVIDLASDIRRRASDMGAADEAGLLVSVAAGLESRVAYLNEDT